MRTGADMVVSADRMVVELGEGLAALGGPASSTSSASKALALIAAMAEAAETEFGVTQLGEMVRVPKSTAHRLLKALEGCGFVERVGAKYRVGSLFFRLSEAARRSEYGELREVACRPLAWLFERSQAVAVHLAVLCGPDVLYLDKICKPAGTRLPSRVGGRFPATCTALGKAIVAHSAPTTVASVLSEPLGRATPRSVVGAGRFVTQLAEIKRLGYATEVGEACHGMMCVAAPVLIGGAASAAVSLSVPIAVSGGFEGRLGMYGAQAIEAATQVAALVSDPAGHAQTRAAYS